MLSALSWLAFVRLSFSLKTGRKSFCSRFQEELEDIHSKSVKILTTIGFEKVLHLQIFEHEVNLVIGADDHQLQTFKVKQFFLTE